MTAALTLGDVTGLVAVLGLLLAPLAAYLTRLHRKVASQSRELELAREHQQALAGSSARGFAGTASALAFTSGVLERLFSERTDEVPREEIIAALGELREAVDRAWAEAAILSDDEVARASARRQLAARLGDDQSPRIAKLVNDRLAE